MIAFGIFQIALGSMAFRLLTLLSHMKNPIPVNTEMMSGAMKIGEFQPDMGP
jgi:hypothetical protein